MTPTKNQMPVLDGMVVFTYTDDLKKGCRLWEQVLGFECAIDQGECRIFRTSPGSYVGVCTIRDRPRSPVGVTISLVTENVDELAQKVADADYEILFGPAYSEQFNVYSCIFLNDDGYRCEIQRFGK